MAVEVGRWYEVLDPSWVDTKGRKSVQPHMHKGQIIQASSIDADGDVAVNIPLPNGRIMPNAAIVAPQHLKPYGPPPP